MDADLLTIARRLAEGGHLPGIYVGVGATTNGNTMVVAPRLYCQSHPQDACTEADIFFAVHNGIKAKEWPSSRIVYGLGACWTVFGAAAPGTDTTALLRAYEAALEAK